jgi:hypothetical protein
MYWRKLAAMTVLLTFLILIAPFAVAVALGWAAHRTGSLRLHAGQLQFSGPMVGRLSDEDSDARRLEHDLDAIRTRFEEHPVWPASGATGERR